MMLTTNSSRRAGLICAAFGSLLLPTALAAAKPAVSKAAVSKAAVSKAAVSKAAVSKAAVSKAAVSKAAVSTPAPGTAERRALMDALRRKYAHDYHEAVVFRVSWLKAGGGYAYLDAAALGANGQPAREFAPMGGSVSAFYHKQNGHWRVLRWGSFGGTDLVDECRRRYPQAPRALFPF